jgi:hypothetical protein
MPLVGMRHPFLNLRRLSRNLRFVNGQLLPRKQQSIDFYPIPTHDLDHIAHHQPLSWLHEQLTSTVDPNILKSLATFHHLELLLMEEIVHRFDSHHQNNCQKDRDPLHPAPPQPVSQNAQAQTDQPSSR